MRLIPVKNLRVGEALGYPIRTQDGKVLLSANSKITEKYIERLTNFKINGVYIEDEIFDDVDVAPAISDETKAMAMNAVGELYKAVAKKSDLKDTEVKFSSKLISDDVRKSIRAPINMFNIFAVDDKRLLHSVNTAVITAAIAYYCEIPLSRIQDYVTAALMHDLFLTDFSTDKDHKHAEQASEYLKSMRTYNNYICASVLMHHEHYDGTGGPKGFDKDRIFEGARIIAVADKFDRLVYGLGCPKYSPHLAVEYLYMTSGKQLDPEMLVKFSKCVAVYPTGATVMLNNGARAIVIKQNEGMPTRPMVKLLMPERENCLEFNLVTNNTVFIESIEI